jgi:hypothetical protein
MTLINPRTILRRIKTAHEAVGKLPRLDPPDLKAAQATLESLQHKAAHEFATLNGWQVTRRDFALEDIGQFRSRNGFTGNTTLDHPLHFKDQRNVCAAIVVQPYHDREEWFRELAKDRGVACHTPPHPQASIHYPDIAFFVVLTMSDHRITWLPEQSAGVA